MIRPDTVHPMKDESPAERLTGPSQGPATVVVRRDVNGGAVASGDLHVNLGVRDDSNHGAGSWLQWAWDGARLHVQSDRFGLYPAYFAESESMTVLSTSLREVAHLIGASAWNDDAMSVFVRVGYFIRNDTPFRGVWRVPAGCNLAAIAGRLNFSETYSPVSSTVASFNRSELMDSYGETFEQVVEGWVHHTDRLNVVPLSGGRDSRHILLALARAGASRIAVTARHFAPKADEDQRIAKLLAYAADTDHTVLEQPSSQFLAESAKNAAVDCTTIEHAWFGVVVRWIKGISDENVVWDGIAGDVLSAGHFLTAGRISQFRRSDWDAFAQDYLGAELAVARILRPELRVRWSRDRAIAHVAREASRYATCANPVGQFFLWNRSRRGAAMASWGMLPFSSPVIAPFLDPRITRLLEPIPAEEFLDYSFHSELIRLRYPKFAEVPFEDKTAPRRIDPVREKDFARRVLLASLRSRGGAGLTRTSFAMPRIVAGTMSASLARRFGWLYSQKLALDGMRLMMQTA